MSLRYPVLVQVVGWTTVAALYYGVNASAPPEIRPPLPTYEAVSLGALGALTSSVLWWLYRSARLPHRGPPTWVAAVAGTAVGATAWFALVHALDGALDYQAYHSPLEMEPGALAAEITPYLFAMAAWHGAVLARHAVTQAARAERLAQEARLQALRYQLNPHFLFNALNSAIALVDEDPRRAQRMLTMLAGLLRRTLDDASTATTLDRELDLVGRYIDVEKVRFEDRLQVELAVDEPARSCRVPPLLLFALVDNAVKHGMRTSAVPLRVSLSASYDGEALRIDVRNTGRVEERPDGGVGLRNVTRRLEALYPERHRFALVEEAGGVRATVEIRGPEVAP